MTTQTHSLCSEFSRSCGEDPGGSAGWYGDFVFIALPLPWAPRIWNSRAAPDDLREFISQMEKSHPKARVMAIVPREDSGNHKDRNTKVIHYKTSSVSGAFSGYQRAAYSRPIVEVVDLLRELFGHNAQEKISPPATEEQAPKRELFVCTHGNRDICCGKLGYPVFEELERSYAAPSDGEVQVWRVSHTGGHRFAPTLLDFPHGNYWGRVDLEFLPGLMKGAGAVHPYGEMLRGCAAFEPKIQMAERWIFEREGWGWFSRPRTSRVLERDVHDDSTHIETSWTDEDGTPRTVRARVEPRDSVETMKSSGAAELTRVPRYAVTLQELD